MDWPLVFLCSFVVVSLGGCSTIGRADLCHMDGASDIIFLGKLKPRIYKAGLTERAIKLCKLDNSLFYNSWYT